MAISVYFKDITVVQSLFSQEGDTWYRLTQVAEKYIDTLLVEEERERDLVLAAH